MLLYYYYLSIATTEGDGFIIHQKGVSRLAQGSQQVETYRRWGLKPEPTTHQTTLHALMHISTMKQPPHTHTHTHTHTRVEGGRVRTRVLTACCPREDSLPLVNLRRSGELRLPHTIHQLISHSMRSCISIFFGQGLQISSLLTISIIEKRKTPLPFAVLIALSQ